MLLPLKEKPKTINKPVVYDKARSKAFRSFRLVLIFTSSQNSERNILKMLRADVNEWSKLEQDRKPTWSWPLTPFTLDYISLTSYRLIRKLIRTRPFVLSNWGLPHYKCPWDKRTDTDFVSQWGLTSRLDFFAGGSRDPVTHHSCG